VIRAASLGLPMALAIIGGRPAQFVPLFDLYREASRRAGHDPASIPLSVNSHGFVAETSQEAVDLAFPAHKVTMDRIGRERGWPPMSRTDFEAGSQLEGAYAVGSPAQVAEKILWQHERFGHDRFLLQLTVGTMPHEQVMRAIELYGSEVAPIVGKHLATD
jgi:alkanesulfonate monooxygenase SsuD/methylene tetrahydromethanopterin reductase-like flavin-dependent oxidoreductase (luciferase family)